MEIRPFGNTGISVSAVTFGAWSIGGPAVISGKQVGWSGVSDEESITALKYALDHGITTFDTADSYASGKSERLIGQALSGMRSQVVLSTKVGLVDRPGDSFTLDFSRGHILQSCHDSLKRLKTDYIDIYLLHMVTDGYPLSDEIRGALEHLKKDGLIRGYGVSVQYPRQAEEQLDLDFGDCIMIEFNMLSPAEAENAIRRAKQKGYGVITRGALGKGLFTGKYRPGASFPADDVRSRLRRDDIDRTLAAVERLRRYAESIDSSLLKIALGFQLRRDMCSTVTIGMKTPQQVRQILDAARRCDDEIQPDWQLVLAMMNE